MLKVYLALALVTFTVANFDLTSAEDQAQAQVVQSVRMKSYLVTPRTSAQIDEIKSVLRVASANYYVHNRLLQPNITTEILVPGTSDMYFRSAMQRAGVRIRVLYEKVKVKKYGMPNGGLGASLGMNDGYPIVNTGINYEIKGLSSQKLIDLEEGHSHDNARIIIYSINHRRNQKWALKSAPGFPQIYPFFFNIVSMETGKCLTTGVDMKVSENQTLIVDYTCQSPYNDSQVWTIEYGTAKKSRTGPNGPTYFKIIGNQLKCLTANPNGQDLSQLYLDTCSDCNDNQFFNFVDCDTLDEY